MWPVAQKSRHQQYTRWAPATSKDRYSNDPMLIRTGAATSAQECRPASAALWNAEEIVVEPQ